MAKPSIAITMGDYNGIGPEIILKSILAPSVGKICQPVVFGSMEVLAYYARLLRVRLQFCETPHNRTPHTSKIFPVVNVFPSEEAAINPGVQTTRSARWAGAAITKAVASCANGTFDSIVTGTVSKSSMIA